MNKKAVVLLSGGLDSATVLAIASKDYDCYALSFDYSQRHVSEIVAAKKIAVKLNVIEHKILPISNETISGSALTDKNIAVPEELGEGIPITYVPARNTIFLAYALSWAEVLNASSVFIGVNAVDYSGYPDCRPEFIKAFEKMANLATRAGVEGNTLQIHTPLIDLKKSEIIMLGVECGVDYSSTVSCYNADEQGAACGRCDSCRLRKQGFKEAGLEDPTLYVVQ